jgi:hypothetical protein
VFEPSFRFIADLCASRTSPDKPPGELSRARLCIRCRAPSPSSAAPRFRLKPQSPFTGVGRADPARPACGGPRQLKAIARRRATTSRRDARGAPLPARRPRSTTARTRRPPAHGSMAPRWGPAVRRHPSRTPPRTARRRAAPATCWSRPSTSSRTWSCCTPPRSLAGARPVRAAGAPRRAAPRIAPVRGEQRPRPAWLTPTPPRGGGGGGAARAQRRGGARRRTAATSRPGASRAPPPARTSCSPRARR